MKAAIFDLDGTLVDSAADLHAAAARMMESFGWPVPSLEAVTYYVGNGIPKLVERCLVGEDISHDEAVLTTAYDRFIDFYQQAPATLTNPYPGVTACLEELGRKGWRIGVCTNKTAGISESVLEATCLSAWVEVLVGGDTLPVRKPDPAPLRLAMEQLGAAPSDAVYIGDSEVDSETAAAAGIRFALFTEGYRKSPVVDIAHDFAFEDYSDLRGYLAARQVA